MDFRCRWRADCFRNFVSHIQAFHLIYYPNMGGPIESRLWAMMRAHPINSIPFQTGSLGTPRRSWSLGLKTYRTIMAKTVIVTIVTLLSSYILCSVVDSQPTGTLCHCLEVYSLFLSCCILCSLIVNYLCEKNYCPGKLLVKHKTLFSCYVYVVLYLEFTWAVKCFVPKGS